MEVNNKIHQQGDNYIIDFMKYYKGKRVHIYKTGFSSYEEAEKEIPHLMEAKLSKVEDKIDPTLGDFFELYKDYRSTKVSKSTLLTIDSVKSTYINDILDKKVSNVFDARFLLIWRKKLIDKPNICDKWKNRIIGEFRLMSDFAFKMKFISSDACLESKAALENVRVKSKRKEKSFYSPRQLKKFLSVIEDKDDLEMFKLFSYLGARLSEFIGLTWDTYNPVTKTIEIKQQIIYLKEKRPILVETLKTKESYRFCKLNDEINDMLKERRKESSEGFIFPKSKDKPFESMPKTAFRLKMVNYMNKAKLPIISAHGFRHTKATMLMSVCLSMADIKAAARFLGHSVTMMMETYAHENKKNTEAIIKRLDQLL